MNDDTKFPIYSEFQKGRRQSVRHVYAAPTLLYGDWGPPSIPNTLPLNPT